MVRLHAEQKVDKEAFFAYQQKVLRETAAQADFDDFKAKTASGFEKAKAQVEALELHAARRNGFQDKKHKEFEESHQEQQKRLAEHK